MATRAIERGQPIKGIGRIVPLQGEWTENDYINLCVRRLVEFSDGVIEILPMPTTSHQDIVLFLLQFFLQTTAASHPGKVLMAPIKLKVRSGKFREPDLILALARHVDAYVDELFWNGADLIVEVVSPKNASRDHKKKRREYAEAGIPEYWIVDPQRQTFTVLTCSNGVYDEVGVFRPGESAASKLLDGVTVDVAACFASGRPKK